MLESRRRQESGGGGLGPMPAASAWADRQTHATHLASSRAPRLAKAGRGKGSGAKGLQPAHVADQVVWCTGLPASGAESGQRKGGLQNAHACSAAPWRT